LIQGPKGWKSKGYTNIRKIDENGVKGSYFADGLGYTLSRLGFNGYISCDECEIFLSHEAMKKVLTYPFRMDYGERGGRGDDDEELQFLLKYCMKQSHPLSVTQSLTRDKKQKMDYYVFEELKID